MVAEFDAVTLRVLFGLFQVVILAILIERGLYFIFDYQLWRDRLTDKGIKAPVALGVSWLICSYHDFDVIARVIDPGAETKLGIFITATIVAGGSAAAMVLFNDVLKFTRSARAQMKEQANGQ